MKYYENNFVEAIERAQSYAQFLQVEAQNLILEISQAFK